MNVDKSSFSFLFQGQLALITKFVNAAHYCCEIRNYATCIQIVDALEMFVVRQLPVYEFFCKFLMCGSSCNVAFISFCSVFFW